MIKYPNGKIYKKNNIEYANRGMSFEDEINQTNRYYLDNNIAVIYKKPTPINVVKTLDNKILQAYYACKSTTDYNGVYNGYYIDFDVKETNSTTSFNINNILKHQIDHLKKVHDNLGIAFILIKSTYTNEVYLLLIEDLLKLINSNQKSIKLSWLKENCKIVPTDYKIAVDYIKIIKEIIENNG